ncbi:hypothetical protein D3C76_1130650 [compost metagenome]
MLIVTGEIGSDTQQASTTPLNLLGGFFPQLFHHQPAKFSLVIQQPVEIEQALINHIFVAVSLVLDDDRAAIFIETQRVDTTFMGLSGGVFGREKTHAKEGVHVRLNQVLQMLFNRYGAPR